MANFKKLRTWLLGAAGAGINAGTGGIVVYIVDPVDFNPFDPAGLIKLLKVCVALGILGFGLYVKEHPIQLETILEEEHV